MKAIKALQAMDERSGSVFAYIPNTSQLLGQYNWSLDENDALHFEVFPPANPFVRGSRFVGVINSDNSGEFRVYIDLGSEDVLIESYKWNSVGDGEWWEYENGEMVHYGTWG